MTEADLIQYPWYHVLGNHEYGYNVSAQLDLTGLVRNWNLPARYVDSLIYLCVPSPRHLHTVLHAGASIWGMCTVSA
jgi:hypothetical protein